MKKLLWGYFTLLIYFLWIWFISWSIVHFTLNPWRFWLIGLVWWVLFAVATYIQDFLQEEDKDANWKHILHRVLTWVFLSLWLWMISWSIQHFDEITYEALWYIPIGTAVSLIARWVQESELRRETSVFAWIWVVAWWTIASILISWYVQMAMFPNGPVWWHHEDGESEDDHPHEWTETADHHETSRVPKTWVLTRKDYTNEEKLNIHMCLMWWWTWCDDVLDENKRETYADAIQEQCEIMPGMADCDAYFGTVSAWVDLGEEYDLERSDDYIAKKAQDVVNLGDRDSYAITMDNINTTIWWKEVRMMWYNGSIPGPLIKVDQWSVIDLTVTNNIWDIVSTVHHHGLRWSDKEDGVPVGMWWFDVPIKKGETLSYKLQFPDAGIYRYHPHVREDLQQELGMYGNYLVQPADPSYRNTVDDEQILILDDIQMDQDGVAPFYKEHVNQAIMWRFWTNYLINGSEDYTLDLTKGAVTRMYITNTANVRPFNISFPWIEMKLVWWDLGAYEKEQMIDSLLIAPAERYVVELFPETSGEFDLVYKNPAFTETIGTVRVAESEELSEAGTKFSTLRSVATVVEDIDQYRSYIDAPVDKTLRLDMTLNGKTKDDLSLKMAHANDGTTAQMWGLNYDLWQLERRDEMFDMNVISTDETTKRQLIDEDTNKVSMKIDDRIFQQWDIVKIRIDNDGEGLHPMQHPVHFHGQRFLIVNKNGVPNDNLVRKDTVLTLPWEYTDILVDMSNPWKRMAHCHIAEHNESGMMMNFTVLPTST